MEWIWKLIELLNEYEENRPMELPKQYRRKEMPTFKWWLVAISEYDDEMEDNSDLLVISKFNWFIKWLVDNDKIERKIFCEMETPSSKYEDFDLWPETPREDYTNILLMDLAIQDNPIEFLISILK